MTAALNKANEALLTAGYFSRDLIAPLIWLIRDPIDGTRHVVGNHWASMCTQERLVKKQNGREIEKTEAVKKKKMMMLGAI